MPLAGDIIRTRFCIELAGKPTVQTFWWKLLHWPPNQDPEEALLATGLSWLAACDAWINDTFQITYWTWRNLSNFEHDTSFQLTVTGLPSAEPVRVAEGGVWITRYGVDLSGNACRSSFPLTNIIAPETRGRIEGDGQRFQIIEFFTEEHFIISPLAPRWIGGFISRKDGSFVQNSDAFINPVVKSLKTRRPDCTAIR